MASTVTELLRRRFGGKKGRLPDAYLELATIANSSNMTNCAQTNIDLIPNDANWRFVGSWMRIGVMNTSYCAVFKAYTAEAYNAYRIIRSGSSYTQILANGGNRANNAKAISSVNSLNIWYNYDMSFDSMTINGTTTSLNLTTGPANTSSLILCDGNFPQRIGEFKAYHNDVLVVDLVPCKRISDSKIGLYDIVRERFFTSSNTNNFYK